MTNTKKAAALVAVTGLLAFAVVKSAPEKRQRAVTAAATAPVSETTRAPSTPPRTLPKLPPRAIARNIEAPAPTDIPYVGPVHREVTEHGDVLEYQEIAPGYVHRSTEESDGFDDDQALEPETAASAASAAVDPAKYGASSLAELEAQVRTRLSIPSDYRVQLRTEERNGKKGLAIDMMPPAAGGAQQPSDDVERERAGDPG